MQAVVFDFDGVIARSMEQHAEAYRRVLAPRGVAVRDVDVFLREGARSESILQDLMGAVPVADLERLADEKQRVFRDLGAPPLYPGAEAMVRAVQEHVPTAVVTGTRRENLRTLIPDLLDAFQAVLSQEAYTHDKPHPEPYLRAAEALGVPPGECVAVENAIRGVQSARAAGYGAVVAITTTLDADQLRAAGAHAVVADHGALLRDLLSRCEAHK